MAARWGSTACAGASFTGTLSESGSSLSTESSSAESWTFPINAFLHTSGPGLGRFWQHHARILTIPSGIRAWRASNQSRPLAFVTCSRGRMLLLSSVACRSLLCLRDPQYGLSHLHFKYTSCLKAVIVQAGASFLVHGYAAMSCPRPLPD